LEARVRTESEERTGEVARPLPVSRAVPLPPPTRAQRARSFLRRVYDKAGDDNIFFLAGAISFNLIVAIVPLLLFGVGVASIFLTARYGNPAQVIVDLVLDFLPAVGGNVNLVQSVRGAIEGVIAGRTGFTALGAFLLVWFSTRLVGTLRSVLQEVFDVAQDRGIVGGKIFDIKAVVIGGALMLVNLGITTEMETLRNIGISELGVSGQALSVVQFGWRMTASYFTAWVLFVGLYRYLPARWIPWKTAIVAATFTATLFEGLKYAFSWYVTRVADYGSTYGNLISAAVLFFWIYYGSIVFILGGEVAQVWTMRRALRSTRAGTLFKDVA
jgi:membrane protein